MSPAQAPPRQGGAPVRAAASPSSLQMLCQTPHPSFHSPQPELRFVPLSPRLMSPLARAAVVTSATAGTPKLLLQQVSLDPLPDVLRAEKLWILLASVGRSNLNPWLLSQTEERDNKSQQRTANKATRAAQCCRSSSAQNQAG
ncbi:hypothetical protein AV530_003423 [Patagioenas fasciata monilis]|uniref:Uncharacterized protein n=1 Tax=Patagioenas fasciata monilis TaxID=372326 RepID=A0A1V4K2E0_PATFA|nr:hypothetical protein AV530_003423 [Patagioenas fasciata monilis]